MGQIQKTSPNPIHIIGGRKFSFPKMAIKWPDNTTNFHQEDEDRALDEELRQLRIMSRYNDSCCPNPVLSLFSCLKSLFCCCIKKQEEDRFLFTEDEESEYYVDFEGSKEDRYFI